MDVQKTHEKTNNYDSISSVDRLENENIEVDLLINAIYQKYGYDFRDYAKASIKRRIMRRMSMSGFKRVSDMLYRVLYDIKFFETLLLDLSINVTEMFRDTSFFLALRKNVLPVLKALPFVKIWHAGCSTGEEVYSLAIFLKEEGFYDRVQIYATDFNEVVLKKAKDGIFPIDKIQTYTSNYQKAGGTGSFGDYYTARYDSVLMHKTLKEKVLFSDHNLVTDWVFGEMNLILCRNVMIYFSRELQDKVFKLFRESLSDNGFLCLGAKESIRFSKYSDCFGDVVTKEKIYKKIK